MRIFFSTILLFSLAGISALTCHSSNNKEVVSMITDTIKLPSPVLKGRYTLEEVLQKRRSVRSYSSEKLGMADVSQILWSAYGVTFKRDRPENLRGGFKTAPSAGARYPLEIYLIAGAVEGLESGVYRYISETHSLVPLRQGDVRVEACKAARDQKMVEEAPICLVYSADFERTTKRYGERGVHYVYVDLGHSAQNVYLQAEALDMHSCAIGAFTDEEIHKVLGLPANEKVIYMMPVGKGK